MAYEVRMPQLAQSVVEGEITLWQVKKGDRVEIDQSLADITTDKVDVELPSPVAGTVLEVLVEQGSTVPIGTPLLYIGKPGESLEGAESTAVMYSALSADIMEVDKRRPAEAPEPPPELAGSAPERKGPVRAAPAVRKRAAKLGLDLADVAGSGPGGRVTMRDVEAAAESSQSGVAAPPSTESSAEPRIEYQPYRGRRKQIGNHLVRSKQTIPHASCTEEVDVTELVVLREQHKAAATERGVRLTYLPYFVAATVRTLVANPRANATFEEEHERIAIRSDYNIGVAVDTEDGLIVPVLHHADRKGLLDLAVESQELAEKARARRLDLGDVQGSTFTVSSVGSDAVLFSVGVINSPEVALLNLHRIQRRPVVVGEGIAIRSMMYVTLTIDHRILDGGDAVRFLRDLRHELETASEWARL